jgi:hypothetical protein
LGVATPVGGAAAPPLRAAVAAPAAAPAAPPPPPQPVVNLLDFDFGDEVAPPPPAASAPAPPQQSPPKPPTANGSLFGGLNIVAASPAAAPPAPSSGDNLLDFMAETSVATTASTPTEQKSSFGLMNSETAAPPAAEIKDTSNMFNNLSLKGDTTIEPASTPVAAAAGSAFGFMNSAGSTDNVTPAPVAAIQRDSFDPLKNITPNSQKQMMQVSPEQMQAMMYQQMMMQQQVQMAQMQMALQQQKRGSTNPQMFMNMPGHVMQNPAASKSTFAFMDQPQKQDDKSFDFVKDAMKTENKKK